MSNKFTAIKSLFAQNNQKSGHINLKKYMTAYRQILDLINSDHSYFIMLYANSGCGKTHLFTQIANELKDRDDVLFLPYPIFNEIDFINRLYAKIFPNSTEEKKISGYDEFIQILDENLDPQSKKTISVLVDEAQMYPDVLLEKMRFLADMRHCKFIFATRTTEGKQVFESEYFRSRILNITMQDIDTDDIKSYIDNKIISIEEEPLEFSKEQLNLIKELIKNNMMTLNKLMFNFFEIYEYFYTHHQLSTNTDIVETKILEMAAIKSELINA